MGCSNNLPSSYAVCGVPRVRGGVDALVVWSCGVVGVWGHGGSNGICEYWETVKMSATKAGMDSSSMASTFVGNYIALKKDIIAATSLILPFGVYGSLFSCALEDFFGVL